MSRHHTLKHWPFYKNLDTYLNIHYLRQYEEFYQVYKNDGVYRLRFGFGGEQARPYRYQTDSELCVGCGSCSEVCTANIIEIKDGMECTVEEIEAFCMDLPRYKRPKEIIFTQIPRNATGKIEKPKLRKMYGADNLVAKENMA